MFACVLFIIRGHTEYHHCDIDGEKQCLLKILQIRIEVCSPMIQGHDLMAVRSCHNMIYITDAVGDDISIFVVVGGPCDGRE